MELKSIHLQNFCQHRDRLVEFQPGMTAVTGPNGVGKSNVLAGLEYSLLGSDPNVGRLTDSINWDAAKDEFAGVTTEFVHGSATWRVTRSLRGNVKPSLICLETEEHVAGADEVNARILEVLGTTKTLVDDYVLVRQGALPAWFYKSPSARSADLSALLGLDNAEKLWKRVGDWLTDKPVQPTTYDADLDEIDKKLEELRALHTATERAAPTCYGISDDAEIAARIKLHEGVLERNNQRYDAKTRLEQQAALVRVCEGALQQAVEAADKADTEAAACLALHEAIGPEAELAETAKQQWQAYDNAESMRNQLLRNSHQLGDMRAALPLEPTSPVSQDRIADDTATLGRLRQDLAELRAQQSHYSRVTLGQACPTCRQIVQSDSELGEEIAALAVEIGRHEDAIAALESALQFAIAVRDTQLEREKGLKAIRDKERDVAELQAALAENAAKPSMAADEVARILDEQTRLDAQLHDLERACDRAYAAVETATQRLENAINLLGQYSDDVQRYAVDDASVEEAHTQLPALRRTESERVEWRNTLQRIVADIAAYQAQRARVEESLRKALAYNRARDRVANLRDVLHRDAAPRRVTRLQLDTLTAVTNEVLAECDVPFTVSATDKFQLLAQFPGGVTPDRRLSGGQLALLSLAFRAAMSGTMLQHVGLLVLDEPTGFIDEANLEKLPSFFRRIREFSVASGLQLLVVTHEARVMGTFDNVITIS